MAGLQILLRLIMLTVFNTAFSISFLYACYTWILVGFILWTVGGLILAEISTAATYVGMIMWGGVEYTSRNALTK